jgi:prevent-host-death family protein
MKVVNTHEAKTHLSRLLDEVAAGAEIVIARAGKPIARLAPLYDEPRPKRLGLLRGKLVVPDSFDAPLPEEVLAAFEGSGS